jgi:Flp pilus assembly pilin Flp
MSEYALILGGIALACVVAVMFLGDRISGLFDRSAKPIAPAASVPSAPATPYPMSLSDCQDGGWQRFSQFASESACNDFVNGIPP